MSMLATFVQVEPSVLDHAELAAALNDPQTERQAAGRYDPQRMTELQLYPFGWEEEDSREWILDSSWQPRSFYAEAAANGRAVTTCLV